MAKKKFIPKLSDLDLLTEPEQLEYIQSACDFLGVPSELGLVSLGFMDSGDGKRKKVLYVHKGATDIIRERRKISVESLAPLPGGGKEFVGFTAVGKDAEGRQEIAVGVVSITGLTGVAVANAVMTAQTKTLRRLTLQYAGGGFLDETEVSETTRSIANSASSLSTVAAQPSTAPSAAAGKDITEPAFAATPTPVPGALVVSAEGEVGTLEAPKAPKERKKRGKNSVSLDSPISEKAAPAEAVEIKPEEPKQAPVAPPVAIPARVEKPAPAPTSEPVINGTAPTTEQKDEFGARLKSEYIYNKDFMNAGFLQSAERGSKNDQMKAFIKKMFPKATINTLAVEQWTHLFNFLDSKKKEIGAAELVKLIYIQIDKKDADA